MCLQSWGAPLYFGHSICRPLHMKQLENCWMDFYEIWYWRVLWKIVKPFQFSFRLAMYDDFTWISTCVSAHIRLNIHPRGKYFEQCYREKWTYIIYSVHFICKSYSFRGCEYSFELSHSAVNRGLHNTATVKKKHTKGSFCSV
jgi:hypothetical protein